MVINISPILFIILSCVPLALCFIVALLSLFSYIFIMNFLSNFVVTDLRDKLITPKVELNISLNSLKRIYLHRSNIYEIELDGDRFCLYLTEKGKAALKLHICGIDGEQERLLALICEKQKCGETVTLPLTLEGKFVGNAEVIETYVPPKSSDKER